MIENNRPLVTDQLLEVQDFRTIIHHFRGILENTPQISKEKPKDVDMWVVGLETLRSQPIMNKNLPKHWEETL